MRQRFSPAVALATALLAATALISSFAGGAPAQPEPAVQPWSADELRTIASLNMSKLAPAPADPSNAVEQLPAAQALGKRLFNDTRLSSNGAVSCASCHSPDKQFQDGLLVGKGVGLGSRRAMPIVGAGHSPWMFWDGRKDSVWSQALGPLEDGVEHGGNRTRFARVLATHYRVEYEALFGRLPDLAGLAQDAGPNGNPAEKSGWSSLPAARRTDVSRVFANMGKAIAAYEKTLAYGPAPFDRYADAVAGKHPRRARDAQCPGDQRLAPVHRQGAVRHLPQRPAADGPALPQHRRAAARPPAPGPRPRRRARQGAARRVQLPGAVQRCQARGVPGAGVHGDRPRWPASRVQDAEPA